MGAIVSFFLSPIGKYLAIGLVAVSAISGVYVKGRLDGRASYKAKIEREIADAVNKGDAARERALRDFDASPDVVPDDGFRRP